MALAQVPLVASPDSAWLRSIAELAAEEHDVSAHEVLVRLLLDLPRSADGDGHVMAEVARARAEQVAARYAGRIAPFTDCRLPPPEFVRARDLRFGEIAEAVARPILERFHYLESFRPDSTHFAGLAAGRLAAQLTVSRLDLTTIAERLPPSVTPGEVVVLARVFAFDWAPRNALSFLMARLVRHLRDAAQPPRLLLTYLNPNLGFSGASYRAANWSLWATEAGTRYAYLDKEYITDRALVARFGTASADRLAVQLGSRIRFSRMRLAPLRIYAYPIDAALRADLADRAPVALERPRL